MAPAGDGVQHTHVDRTGFHVAGSDHEPHLLASPPNLHRMTRGDLDALWRGVRTKREPKGQ